MSESTPIVSPLQWRLNVGLTLAAAAERAGIAGKNPLRTYARYESGAQPCPPHVVEAIRTASSGTVGAESWHRARLAFLARQAAA